MYRVDTRWQLASMQLCAAYKSSWACHHVKYVAVTDRACHEDSADSSHWISRCTLILWGDTITRSPAIAIAAQPRQSAIKGWGERRSAHWMWLWKFKVFAALEKERRRWSRRENKSRCECSITRGREKRNAKMDSLALFFPLHLFCVYISRKEGSFAQKVR